MANMFAREVTTMFPGLDRDILRRWTNKGYLNPITRSMGQKKKIWDYTGRDIQLLQVMVPLYREGIKASVAYHRALNSVGVEIRLPQSLQMPNDVAFKQEEASQILSNFLDDLFSGDESLSFEEIGRRALKLLRSDYPEKLVTALFEPTADGKYKLRK